MACQYCKSKNKVVSTIAWALYLAPLAYSAYVMLKEAGVVDKVVEAAEPYMETAKETMGGAYASAQDFVVNAVENATGYVSDVADSASGYVNNMTSSGDAPEDVKPKTTV